MKFTGRLIFVFLILTLLVSCSDDNEGGGNQFTDNFDRKQMLEAWADNFIIPSFQTYVTSLAELKSSKDDFLTTFSSDDFEGLRAAYLEAYQKWQYVSFYDIGKAEEITLLNYTNVFPTDTNNIIDNVENQNYNLSLPSNFDAQGFPALDFLLYGLSSSESGAIARLSEEAYGDYLSDLVDRLLDLGNQVLNDWQNGYRATFVASDGSSATASVDKLVNDFLFNYEKHLRAGKIGIPAGIFSGNPIATSVEAPYSNVYSKALFKEAFKALQDFFFGNSASGSVTSISSYLDYVKEQNNSDDLVSEIRNQWQTADTKIDELSDSFQDQVQNDNIKMLSAYDELQKAVVLLKVDMMQALNIQVDFVDADGD